MRPTFLLIPILAAVCSAQAQPSPADARTARLHDVGDLVTQIAATVPAADIEFGARSAPPRKTATAQGADSIVRLMRAFVKPPLADNEEIKAVGERWIVVLGRVEQHVWIDRFLQTARDSEGAPTVITVNCRCFSVPELVFLRDIHPAFAARGSAEQGQEESGISSGDIANLTEVIAPGARTTAFLQALEANEDVTSITTPTISLLPLNIGSLSIVNQTAYVRDFEVEVAKNAFVADPVVDVVQDGIMLQTAVTRLENGLLGVSVDAHVAELKRPIETHEFSVGAGPKVTIQLPHVYSTRIESAVEMQSGHMMILAPPPLAGQRMLFVVQVRTNEPVEAPVKQAIR